MIERDEKWEETIPSELFREIAKNFKDPDKIYGFVKHILADEKNSAEMKTFLLELCRKDAAQIESLYEMCKTNKNAVKILKPLLTALENNRIKSNVDGDETENNIEVVQNSGEESLKEQVDVVIIVAVPDEVTGVHSAFNIPKDQQYYLNLRGTYKFTYTKFIRGNTTIAVLIQPRMGMTMAASLATRAIFAFNPKLIAMVGLCGGREGKTNLGDVIVASNVFDYTAGKYYSDHFAYRPQMLSLDASLEEFVKLHITRDNTMLSAKIIDSFGNRPGNRDSIRIHLATIATGTAVVDDTDVIEGIVGVQDVLAGMDMEAYALTVAADE